VVGGGSLHFACVGIDFLKQVISFLWAKATPSSQYVDVMSFTNIICFLWNFAWFGEWPNQIESHYDCTKHAALHGPISTCSLSCLFLSDKDINGTKKEWLEDIIYINVLVYENKLPFLTPFLFNYFF